jgi:hypothetical protein
MKKMILILAIAISSIFAYAGEGNANIDSEILKAFNSEFVTAKDVTWTVGHHFYKASFTFNNQYVSAFYSKGGDLMGVTRNVISLELPIKLQAKLKKDYSRFWITGLVEYSGKAGTSYLITLEDADQKLILRSSGNNWREDKIVEKL